MRKFRIYTALALSVLLLATTSVQVFAAQEEIAVPQAHTHKGPFLEYIYMYYENGSSSHRKGTTATYTCDTCDMIFGGETFWTTEAHSMSSESYNGNNYHSGTLHYCQYERRCPACGYVETVSVKSPVD